MRHKRALAIMLLLLIVLLLWDRLQSFARRQYKLDHALTEAWCSDDNRRVLALVNAGADPNTRWGPPQQLTLLNFINRWLHRSPESQTNGPTILFLACGMLSPWTTEYFMERPTPSDDPTLAQIMLDHGADVNARDRDQLTPLFWAIRFGRPNTVRLLLDYGADVNARAPDGMTPLMEASRSLRDLDTVRLLLAHGADVNAQDRDGFTALHRAVGADAMGVADGLDNALVELLLENRANPNLHNRGGVTPLKLAQLFHRSDSITLLQKAGAMQ